jgi:hypothetical protein
VSGRRAKEADPDGITQRKIGESGACGAKRAPISAEDFEERARSARPDANFPLTPALSLRERENGLAVANKVTLEEVGKSVEGRSPSGGRGLG